MPDRCPLWLRMFRASVVAQSGGHLWKTLIDTANEITPAAAGAMAFFQASVQAKNPDFNLKAQLIDTMADDFIVIEQPREGRICSPSCRRHVSI